MALYFTLKYVILSTSSEILSFLSRTFPSLRVVYFTLKYVSARGTSDFTLRGRVQTACIQLSHLQGKSKVLDFKGRVQTACIQLSPLKGKSKVLDVKGESKLLEL